MNLILKEIPLCVDMARHVLLWVSDTDGKACAVCVCVCVCVRVRACARLRF
jgi:hypothetical protein